VRLARIKQLMESGSIDDSLSWRAQADVVA
jgi:hypothetical protein